MTVLALGPGPGITANDMVQEAKRHLLGMQREPMNRLAEPAVVESSTLRFTYDLGPIQPSSYVQVGLELFYVWAVDVGSKRATVEPAQLGSLSSAHDQGDVVVVNPRFPDFAIFKALNDDIASLSSPSNGLYAMREVDLVATAGRQGFDLPGVTDDLLEIYSIRYRTTGNSQDWVNVTNFELGRDVSTSQFPSGKALWLNGEVPAGRQIRVAYKAGLGSMNTLWDDVAVVTGMPASALDIPPMGAVERLAPSREIKRNFTESQGDSRRATEVPAGAVAGSARSMSAKRAQRITEEAAKLAQRYPIRQWVPGSTGDGWATC